MLVPQTGGCRFVEETAIVHEGNISIIAFNGNCSARATGEIAKAAASTRVEPGRWRWGVFLFLCGQHERNHPPPKLPNLAIQVENTVCVEGPHQHDTF